MRITAISYQTNPHFTGERKNKLKTAAGAAAIALATAAPMAEADAQIDYYRPIYPYPYYNYVPAPAAASVPDCFVVGDMKNYDLNKSMREVYEEIDGNGNENGVISAKEVVRTERKNWNLNNMYPYTTAQMQKTEAEFKVLSELYNEEDSDPNTINYREYKDIMNDYMEVKNTNNFINLMEIFAVPYLYPPPYYHHHHHHRHTSPPHHHHHNHRH